MAALTIRSATPADIAAIVALLADDMLGRTRETGGDPAAYRAAFDAIAANPNDDLLVAEQGGQVVGCFQLTFLPGLSQGGAWRGQIESVRIAAPHRGSGLGSRMIAWGVQRCRERGCRTVQLTTNAARVDAQRFYSALGFKPSHIGMKLDLSP